jgi:Autotransporter beta-domain
VVATGGNYTPGSKYTILTTTSGPVTGTFSGVSVIGGSFGTSLRPTLSYDANDVYLTLARALLPTVPNLSINQQTIASALNAFINSGGNLPAGFQNLYSLSPAQLAQALTQLEGQNNAGGAQQVGYQLMNEFLLLMLNPFDSDRAGFGGAGFGAGGVARFSSDGGYDSLPDDATAYAAKTSYHKAPVAPAPKRWNVWAAAFGGSNNTNGDPNGVGSVNFSAQTGAVAAGVDYKLTPDTPVGVALAGGGTSWGLAQGLGSGHSDAFQAGLYGSQRFGAWYLSGAAAFANYWASTSRQISLPAIDTLNANFNAQSWGGRLEGGYRFAWGAFNLAPYAAFQAQSFSTPNYSEASGSGSNQFALSYASGPRLVDIRRRTGEPAQTRLSVRGDRRERLVDLMHDRGCHLIHGHALGDARHFGAGLAQRINVGHVAQAADEQHAAFAHDWRDREFERKLLAILAEPGHLDAPAQNHGRARLQIAFEAVVMGVAVALRDDEIGHGAPDHLVARPSEDTDGAIIPVGDRARGGHDDDGVEGRLQQQTQPVMRRGRVRNARYGKVQTGRHDRPRSCPLGV